MSEDRLKDFHKNREKIRNQENTITETIELKQKNIKQEAETIGELKKCENKYSYLNRMMDDVPEDQILSMSDEEYLTLTNPIMSTTISGEAFTDILGDTRQAGIQYEQHYDTCASLLTTCSSGTSGYWAVSEAKPEWFPHRNQISYEYKVEDEVHNQIEYIGTYLNDNIPQIAADFDVFIKKYRAFKADSSKYQDLIGGRSMFFFKMIFDFAKQNFGVENPRIDAIRIFVFGSAKPLPLAESIIKSCRQLYSDFSNQKNNVPSIKAGNVTPLYVETMFRRLIGNIASLLRLRETHFKP